MFEAEAAEDGLHATPPWARWCARATTPTSRLTRRVSAEDALNCGNCGAPMRALRLAGHYGQAVEIDLCAACHLVWFDAVESARLPGPALLELIGEMAAAQSLAHQPLNPAAVCPRCRGGLKTVHNQSRWGRSLQLECRRGHGAYQSFAQFLAEKGLVRPLSSADRARLLQGGDDFPCLNCGGPISSSDAACPWCTSVPGLFDLARLARALDPEGATEAHALHRTTAQTQSLHCLACGAPSAPALTCTQCGATLATPPAGRRPPPGQRARPGAARACCEAGRACRQAPARRAVFRPGAAS